MRYIKLYEEFRHDEIHDVMMSSCDTVSFNESDVYPSTERVRVYETSEVVEFDPKQYEEYLEGWKIVHKEEMEIVFIKGDLKEAGLSWLNEIYGNLKPDTDNHKIFYVDGKRNPLFMYDVRSQNLLKHQLIKNGHYYINYYRIWSLFDLYFGMEYNEIQDLMKVWLGETYNLKELTPIFDCKL